MLTLGHHRCHDCQRMASILGCGATHWSIDLDGFGDSIWPGRTRSAARYRLYSHLREIGYFSGRNGFTDFLHRLGSTWKAH